MAAREAARAYFVAEFTRSAPGDTRPRDSFCDNRLANLDNMTLRATGKKYKSVADALKHGVEPEFIVGEIPYTVVIEVPGQYRAVSCGHWHQTRETAEACRTRLIDKEDGSTYDYTEGCYDWTNAVVKQPERLPESIKELKGAW